jgi:uncharacterized protein
LDLLLPADAEILAGMRPHPRVLRSSDFKRSRWKNGLGWTDQIAIFPENADLKKADFEWRISTARIEQSADFSAFADHDRILVVIEGTGVRISHTFDESEDPEIVELGANEPYEFPGDVPTRCELTAGPIQDFSVFIRKGVAIAEVQVVQISGDSPLSWQLEGKTGLIFVLQGQVDFDETTVSKGEALRIDLERGQAHEPTTLKADDARILLIQIA